MWNKEPVHASYPDVLDNESQPKGLMPVLSMISLTKANYTKFWHDCPRWSWLAFLILGLVGIFPPAVEADTTNYVVHGVLKRVNQDEHQLVITHEKIPNFMDAMTMSFNVKDVSLLTNVTVGAKITFQLHITETESWVDHIEELGGPRLVASNSIALPASGIHSEASTNSATAIHSKNPLRTYKFTNELGQPVSLADFRGNALALTFFFTRCPMPDFCPRLSRNFEEVQSKLGAMPNAPTNWHLLSISFDTENDTPAMLKAYGASYQYDPAHWTFMTGPQDKITELARLCDVKFEPDQGGFSHNFRTLIIDPSNHLQMVFPTSGNLSDAIVDELLKAMGGTNRVVGPATNQILSASKK